MYALTAEQKLKLKNAGYRRDEISRFKTGDHKKLSAKKWYKMNCVLFGKRVIKPIQISADGIKVKTVRIKINRKAD